MPPGKTLTAAIDLDTKKGIKGAQDLQKQVIETGQAIEDLRTPGKIAADAIAASAERIKEELEADEAASKALRDELERLGADTANVDEYVAQLRKMGLTADDIRADVDTLAGAIKEMEDVARTAGAGADDGIRRVGDASDDTKTKVKAIGDTADQSGSVLANAMGNSVQDVAALGGVAGTAGMALGQIAEYATEGNISLKELGKVAGPLLGVAAAGMAISKVMGDIEKAKALRAENVEGFTEAIREGEDAAAALRDRLREAGKVEFARGGLFGGTADATGAILAVGSSMQDFSRVVTGNREELDAWIESIYRAEGFTLTAQTAVRAATQYWEDNQKAVKQAAESAEIFALSQDDVNNKVREYLQQKEPLDTMPETWQRIADAMKNGTNPAVTDLDAVTKALGITVDDAIAKAGDLADKQLEEAAAAREAARAEAEAEQAARNLALGQKEAAQAAAAHRYEHEQLMKSLSDQSSWLALQDQFDNYEKALADADAAVAAGTLTAEQGERRKQQALIDTKQRVADYATEVLGLPAEMVTAILADIDNGSVADAETLLEELTKQRTVPVKIQVINPGGGGFYAGGGTTPGAPGGYTKITTSEFGAEDIYVPNGSKVRTASQTIQDAQAAGGGGNTYNLYLTAGLGADMRSAARELMDVIREIDRIQGPAWRTRSIAP